MGFYEPLYKCIQKYTLFFTLSSFSIMLKRPAVFTHSASVFT